MTQAVDVIYPKYPLLSYVVHWLMRSEITVEGQIIWNMVESKYDQVHFCTYFVVVTMAKHLYFPTTSLLQGVPNYEWVFTLSH